MSPKEKIDGGASETAARVYWLIQRLADVPEGDDWLCEAERARASGMRFAKRRDEWRLGRWTAKSAILAFCGIVPIPAGFRSLDIRSAADGSPDPVLDGQPAPVSISISHSGGMSLCAVSRAGLNLGCDLEETLKGDIGFFADYFTCDEMAAVQRTTEAARKVIATLIWSAKESALKSTREGLRRDTRNVEVHSGFDLHKDLWSPLSVQCTDAHSAFEGWYRIDEAFVQTITADHPLARPLPIDTSPP